MPNQRARSVAAILILLATLQGCSTLGSLFSSDKETVVDKRNAPEIYADAKEQLEAGMYDRAIKLFEQLEAKYPYGRYAQQAQLEIAYAYYHTAEPASAMAAIERFIKLHPNHPSIDYAYYLKGLINFNDRQSMFDALGRQDAAERDPKAAQESYDAFKELVTRFPKSKYAEDSRIRMSYLTNTLARHQLYVADYYYRLGAYLAAANRAQIIIKDFPQSTSLEESLGILASSYRQMGMNDLADDALRVKNLNFPQGKTVAQASTDTRRWWKVWDWSLKFW